MKKIKIKEINDLESLVYLTTCDDINIECNIVENNKIDDFIIDLLFDYDAEIYRYGKNDLINERR